MKLKKQQILDEVKQVQSGSLSSTMSEVYDEWADMATEWLTDDPSEYLKNGFDGFNDRSPEQILCDFYLAGKVEDMDCNEFNKVFDSL